MRDELSVDPETLLRASARFDLESVELGSALSRLQATLGSLGDVYVEVDEILKQGTPNKDLRAKLVTEIAALGPTTGCSSWTRTI